MNRSLSTALLAAAPALFAGCFGDYTLVFGGTAAPDAGGHDGSADAAIPPGDAGDDTGIPDAGDGPRPRICPDLALIDFGTVIAGAPETRTLHLRSCGDALLSVDAVEIVGGEGWFTLDAVAPPVPAMVPTEVVITVSCNPQSAGTRAGQIAVRANDPGLREGVGYVRLVCRGQEPPRCTVKADPDALNFGKLAAGERVTGEFEIINTGDAACTVSVIEGPAAGAFSITGITDDTGAPVGGAPFGILPTRRVRVAVAFTAPPDRACPAEVVAFTNDSVNLPRLAVGMKGCGGEEPLCRLSASPAGGTLAFGDIFTGSKRTMGVALANSGTTGCRIDGATWGPLKGGWFSVAADATYPIAVEPGKSGRVEVTCAPPAGSTGGPAPNNLGVPDPFYLSNVITVQTSDPAQPVAAGGCTADGFCYRLRCNGITGRIDVLPESVEFGPVTAGCGSAARTVTYYNNGSGPVTINTLTISPARTPAAFTITGNPKLPFTIPVGGTAEVSLVCRPSKPGIETALLAAGTDLQVDGGGAPEVALICEQAAGAAVADRFTQPERPMVDVLFCVDNSGSMGGYQSALAANFPSFISYANSLGDGIDYQVGVVTAEVNEAARGETGDMIYPGVLFQRAGFPRVIANDPPDPLPPPYRPRANALSAFSGNAMPGRCCADRQEACMEAAKMALSPPNALDDTANNGFLRRYAKLAVIMVSDEDDQSPGTVGYYTDFFRSLKRANHPDMLSLSIIGMLDETATPPVSRPCKDGTSSPPPCADRYLALYEAIGSGRAHYIGTNSWGAAMSALGLDAFTAINEFFLSRPPEPATLYVAVNGAAVSPGPIVGYVYDPEANSIVFGSGAIPPKGAAIEVRYTARCD